MSGGDELRRFAADLGNASQHIADRAGQVITKTALSIEADAKILAPVDTGFLQGSISTDLSGDRLTAEIGPTAEYAGYVEQGTSRMAPQPYLGPASDRWEPGFVQAMEQLAEDVFNG